MSPMTTSELAARLSELGYDALFLRGDDAQRMVWDGGSNQAALSELVRDTSLPDSVRFLASEILFQHARSYPPIEDRSALAALYARMLASAELTGNAWGLPGQMSGEVGEHLLAIGDAAIPELVPLLDDSTPVWFEGSEEATTGNAFGLRTRDLAAAFITRLRGQPADLPEDVTERDRLVARVQAAESR